MIELRPGVGAESSSTLSSRAMISKPSFRRRRSKGTIAGFASGKAGGDPSTSSPGGPDAVANISGPQEASIPSSTGATSGTGQGNQPQHTNESSSSSASGRPCHSARLALLCSQNAIRMGARTQLGLCPPGRARRGLKLALRQKMRSARSTPAARKGGGAQPPPTDIGGYFGVDKMVGTEFLDDYTVQEEDFLMSANTFDIESDEEASSGDDDELTDVEDLLKEDSPALDEEKKYINLNEPLFTPNGADVGLNHGGIGPLTSSENGKLPFNRRKIRYFDSISAADTMMAREYLQTEARRSKQKDVALLAKRLRRIQREEKLRLKQERGIALDDKDFFEQENDDSRALVPSGVTKFQHPMTPATSAALIIESLSLNPLESIEGMSKCYEGIVAAGVALLESLVNDPTSPTSTSEGSIVTRSEIVAALTPLLITSLEQASGEVILTLAKLRRMCGTPRYQRRFVQRVAPSLIRPPRGAMWCLRHQNDMEPILAAAELIFDSAFEIFSKGWYDRGQLLLADSKRAETLNTAAMQLRNLSTGPGEHLTLGGHTAWRTRAKDVSKTSNDHLAEWEVIAVDRQIRVSISNLISTEWAKVVVNPRDSDAARAIHRSRKATKRSHGLPQVTAGESPKSSIVPPPQSPARPSMVKVPMSPHSQAKMSGSGTSFQSDNADFSFPTNFPSSFDVPASERISVHASPTFSSQAGPLSPPEPNRTGVDEFESRHTSEFSASPSNLFSPSLPPGHTPPRSPNPPRSPKREPLGEMPNSTMSTSSDAASPINAWRKNSPSTTPVKESISKTSGSVTSSQFPVSPSSAGTNDSPNATPYRPIISVSSTSSPVAGAGSQPAHYRMLTSTSAERKRTVAACRALRAQITRFEDAFIQLHGRPPKGAAERAPLATTYAQYREWKRAIRADAACRIQALMRGARTRLHLLRSDDAQMRKVVNTRAGRSSSLDLVDANLALGQSNELVRLQIPTEIGDSNQDVLSHGSDPFDVASGKLGQTLPPQWGGNQSIRRPRPGVSDGFPASPIPKPTSSASASTATSGSEVNLVSLPELQARKRDLKQQLKQYDMNFARRHGRMPVKAEKEPIRHLYEKYNALKSQISLMEQEGRQTGVASPASPVPPASILPQRTLSPASGVESMDDSPFKGNIKPVQRGSPTGPSNSVTAPLSQDLGALKAEKGRLHHMLRSYEKDFYKEHKRQVSSFADIRPVASQYRRYKEIKKAIAALQQGVDR